jgi:aminopeptidase 2
LICGTVSNTIITQLVAFVSGPLAEVKSETSRVPLSVLCPIGYEKDARYALELAARGLQLFEELLGSPYPLPKLDLVAIPDFAAEAMENWGMIMFRTTALLLDPEDSAWDTKQRVTEVILHEISHMWFGNLVTMRYWDGLWLKEGFATLMAWKAMDDLHPDWKVWDNYVSGDLQTALELDSLQTSHAVELVITDAAETKQIFDAISYKKGCCVLTMICKELGWDGFLGVVKAYLDRHKYGSTESEDLWKAFEEITGSPYKDRMHTWTKEAGYPVVSVTEVFDGDKNTVKALELRQERFIASAAVHGVGQASQRAHPLVIGIRSGAGLQMIEMQEREMTINITEGGMVFKVNADHDGFFRTAYSAAHLRRLTRAAVEGQHLTLRDSIGLLYDLRALVKAGINRSSELLDASLELTPMGDYLVWEAIDRNLRSVREVLKFSGVEIADALDRLMVDVLGAKARALGWTITGEDDNTQVAFKSSMFSGAGLAGDKR